MQLNVDADERVLAAINEILITFKPSPNFKNMKKFLKSRMGDADSMMDSPESPTQHEEIQPPLPLDPPPLDKVKPVRYHCTPSDQLDDKSMLLTTPKQERTTPEPEIKCEVPIEYVEETKPLKPICKDFIRGSCSRVGCKYRHEIDLSQLRGIFIFCHNFQNSVCNKPNCRYVHASVFEEQRFYRTGKLPKVLMHKSEPPAENGFSAESQKLMLPPPPPPPPPPPATESIKDLNVFTINMSKPPPHYIPKQDDQMLSGIYKQNQMANLDPKSSMTGGKRTWLESDEGFSELFNSPTPQENGSRAKRINDGKCGSCKVMENRLKFAVDRLKAIVKSTAEVEVKIAKTERTHKLLLQLVSVMSIGASARRSERDIGTAMQSSIFSPLDLLRQSPVLSDNLLGQFKEDLVKVSSQQTSSWASHLKQLIQTPPVYNKINTSDDNGSKAYQISTQHLMQQLQPASNAQYQLQSNTVSTAAGDQNPVRLPGAGATRQLSNLLNGW